MAKEFFALARELYGAAPPEAKEPDTRATRYRAMDALTADEYARRKAAIRAEARRKLEALEVAWKLAQRSMNPSASPPPEEFHHRHDPEEDRA